MMDLLFDYETIMKNYDRELREDIKAEYMAEGIAEGEARGKAVGLAEGKAVGLAEGKLEATIKFYRDGLIKTTDAAKMLNISEDEFLQIVK